MGFDLYSTVWSEFMKTRSSDFSPKAIPLIAEFDGEPVAAVFVYNFSGRAYYIYGMSREIHREKMPNHLLQWETMRYAKSIGCRQYDLWGAPNSFTEEIRCGEYTSLKKDWEAMSCVRLARGIMHLIR